MKAENMKIECEEKVEKKVTIKLNQEEYSALARFAKRDRRVVSAQAAEMLSDALEVELEEERYDAMPDPEPGQSGEITPLATGALRARYPSLDAPQSQAAQPKTTKESGLETVDGDGLGAEVVERASYRE